MCLYVMTLGDCRIRIIMVAWGKVARRLVWRMQSISGTYVSDPGWMGSDFCLCILVALFPLSFWVSSMRL
jgi:hypothetical protein